LASQWEDEDDERAFYEERILAEARKYLSASER
jgi:hypothetical protein